MRALAAAHSRRRRARAGGGRTADWSGLHAQNGELRARVQEITKGSYELGAEWLRGFDERELPMPARASGRVIHALIEGLVMQRILTPELCPDDVFYSAFAALARG